MMMQSWIFGKAAAGSTAPRPSPLKSPQTVLKVVLLGAHRAGKSSLLQRIAEGKFFEEYTPTIGVDFNQTHLVSRNVRGEELHFRLQIWDTTNGRERYRPVSAGEKGRGGRENGG
jgi:small GTP-binding protein